MGSKLCKIKKIFENTAENNYQKITKIRIEVVKPVVKKKKGKHFQNLAVLVLKRFKQKTV